MGSKDDRGQLTTLEGITAALILVGLLLYIAQSASVTSPQTEMTTVMKLHQKTADTLICIDRLDETNCSDLKTAIEAWGGNPATFESKTPPGDAGIEALDRLIDGYFPPDTGYNLELHYYDGADHSQPLILHGKPTDNSAVATRLVTLNPGDSVSAFWAGKNRYPQVVEVRLTSWYI